MKFFSFKITHIRMKKKSSESEAVYPGGQFIRRRIIKSHSKAKRFILYVKIL